MNTISKLLTGCFAALAVFLAAGCQSTEPAAGDPGFQPKANERLSRAELDFLVRHAQTFTVESDTVKKRLTKQQLLYIRKTRPEIRERYSAPRYGLLEMRWRVSRMSEVVLRMKGRLDSKRPDWRLEICTTQETAPVPDGFLDPELKELSLPPK